MMHLNNSSEESSLRTAIDADLFRMIGSRLDRIDQKLPNFDLKIKDLKEEEAKVAR